MPMHAPTISTPRQPLKSPVPYFGGKSRVAPIIWAAFGADVANYIDPFTGSAATVLVAPPQVRQQLRQVVLNDLDCLVANAWRAVRDHPERVAELLDIPLIEAEQEARHKRLCDPAWRAKFERRVRDDVDFSDPDAAAWWIYVMSTWIGAGVASGTWHGHGDPRTRGTGLAAPKLPHMTSSNGAARSTLRAPGQMLAYFRELQAALRGAKILSGDWSRCVGRYLAHTRGPIGVLLDPPYADTASRADHVYRCDDLQVAHKVRDWALAATAPGAPLADRLRVVLCGYDGEHDQQTFDRAGWTTIAWSAQGGYANRTNRETRGQINRHRERLWLSPACAPHIAALRAMELPADARVVTPVVGHDAATRRDVSASSRHRPIKSPSTSPSGARRRRRPR